MTTLRQAAEAVMEQLKHGWVSESDPVAQDLKAALAEPGIDPVDEYRKGFIAGQIDMRDRPEELAEPVQEPVAYRFQSPATEEWLLGLEPPAGSRWEVEPLFTAPPQRKPLSNEEIRRIYETHRASVPLYHAIARAIENAHGIK